MIASIVIVINVNVKCDTPLECDVFKCYVVLGAAQ